MIIKIGLTEKSLDILIKDEKIIKIGKDIKHEDCNIIDSGGLYIIPGLVDMHAHLREPGQTHKETIKTGTMSASKGGITTVLTMPNTTPALDNPEIIRDLKSKIEKEALIEVLIASAMTKERKGLEPVDFIRNSKNGITAFSDDGSGLPSLDIMVEVCKRAHETQSLLIEHPECDLLLLKSPISHGKLEKKFGIQGQPAEAEEIDILTLGTIAGTLGVRVHFTHISTEKSVEAIKFLKRFYPEFITCDCTPHHLFLSENDITSKTDTNKKINPPLRPESDRLAIEMGLLDGWIDAIATDHAPHSEAEKKQDFAKAPSGTIGFETFLPVTFSHLVKGNKISILEWINLVSYKPAKILGIERGTLETGKQANITIFNPDEKTTIKKSGFISKGKNSAFINREYSGVVKHTICGGEIVYSDKE